MAGNRPWWHTRAGRMNRRSVIQAAALGAGSAALAIACGGGGRTRAAPTLEQKQEQARSSIAQRVDTSAQATRGGIYRTSIASDAANLDPAASPSYRAHREAAYVYSRLVKYKLGIKVPATGEVEPDLSERWEQPDPLHLIFKLRPDAVWDERAPTDKRPVDAGDVVFSWKRFAATSVSRANLAHKVSPLAPVVSAEATDTNTVVFTLAFPYAPLLPMLAYTRHVFIMPREADGGFDPRAEMRGSGAFIQQSYQRNLKIEYRRNPNWWQMDRPFLDGFDISIIKEYAAGLAQFRAGQIWHYPVRQSDIIQTKKDIPALTLLQDDYSRECWQIYFGLQPGSPFLDVRVRRAASMLINRDEWIDTFGNVTELTQEGYPTGVRWHSHISSGWETYWLDPRTDAIGEGKTNFAYNPAEAKKLLAAAGYPEGIATDIAYINSGEYGVTFPRHAEVFKRMLEANDDFTLSPVNPEYQTEYLPRYYYGRGDFKGIAVGAATNYPDPDLYLFAYYHSQGSRQKVALNGKDGDARGDSLIEAQRRELDTNKRIENIKEWQRYVATRMSIIPYPGQAPNYFLQWPWVGNRGAFRTFWGEAYPQESGLHWWFDRSKYTA